jgi:hypothetical protein
MMSVPSDRHGCGRGGLVVVMVRNDVVVMERDSCCNAAAHAETARTITAHDWDDLT